LTNLPGVCVAYLISMAGITNHGPFWFEVEPANGCTWRVQLFCHVGDQKWQSKWNPPCLLTHATGLQF